jgi:hypothetical protein
MSTVLQEKQHISNPSGMSRLSCMHNTFPAIRSYYCDPWTRKLKFASSLVSIRNNARMEQNRLQRSSASYKL